jgi:hypothetical protein
VPNVRSDVGRQQPRVSSVPPRVSSTGQEAVELAEAAGLFLDPWEQLVLSESLGERADGKWAAFDIGLVVPRQNGKGAVLEARELAGLFLLDEQLIIHSAHQFDTSLEHFRRLKTLIENTPEFSRRVKNIKASHGEEGIELHGGQRIRFRTRTKGGGRGFSGDLVVFDEAMDFPESAHGAILPTLSAKSVHGNPQVWYVGSAVDQWVHEHGIVFARIRERGHRGDDESLAYFEWSAHAKNPEDVFERADDPELWAMANPALGIRISAEHIDRERRSMDFRTFAVERLNVGDWPSTDGSVKVVINLETWANLLDAGSKMEDPVCLTFDVTPDRSWASIGAAGRRADGLRHVELIDRHGGTSWVASRVAELANRHKPSSVLCDGASPAASLIASIEALGVEVKTVSAKEYAQACGVFYDDCEDAGLRHTGDPAVAAALKGAKKRSLGDAWAWSRKSSAVDISPLVAVTLAGWGVSIGEAEPEAVPLIGFVNN